MIKNDGGPTSCGCGGPSSMVSHTILLFLKYSLHNHGLHKPVVGFMGKTNLVTHVFVNCLDL